MAASLRAAGRVAGLLAAARTGSRPTPMNLFSIFLLGFLLGIKHATEADHLAAVATLATGRTTLVQTLRQGVAWGLGHSLTLLLFGGVVLTLDQAVSPHLQQALEGVVGLMLIGLGADLLRRLRHQQHRRHEQHQRLHFQAPPGQSNWPVRALAVGMMHGLAGTAALVLLSLQAVPSAGLGLAYMGLFGLGSIAGMALLSGLFALLLRLSARHQRAWLHHGVHAAVGAFSCLLGAAVVLRTGLVQTLLA